MKSTTGKESYPDPFKFTQYSIQHHSKKKPGRLKLPFVAHKSKFRYGMFHSHTEHVFVRYHSSASAVSWVLRAGRSRGPTAYAKAKSS
jgi:hypothetical protein